MWVPDWWRRVYLDYRRYRASDESFLTTVFLTQGFWASVVYRVSSLFTRFARSCGDPGHGSMPTAAIRAQDADLLRSDARPIHPARIIGELMARLTADSIVIGDGGDFVGRLD